MADSNIKTENETEYGNTVQFPNAIGDIRYYTGIDWASLLFRILENIHWILIVAFLCAAVNGFYVSRYVTPIYQAVSKIYIAGSDTSISLSDLQLGSSLATDYQEAFKIWHVHDMVAEKLGLNYSYGKLSGMVSVSSPSGSHILYIDVKSSDPQEAKLLADTYAEVAQDFIAEKMELRRPQLIQVALLPSSPISPNIRSSVIQAFLIGAFAAAAVVVFLYLLDDRIRTGEDIEIVTGLGTLGVLAKQETDLKNTDAMADGPLPLGLGSHTAQITKEVSLGYAGDEAINMICSSIMFMGKSIKRIAITSYEANEGKSFIAMHIARSMAVRGKKVLLIDGDLRKASLKNQYGIRHTTKGLAHLLSDQGTWEECVYPTNIPNLSMLPAGEAIKIPLPLLTTPDFESAMKRSGKNFDLVIVDTPPIGIVVDAAEITKQCDGCILVLEYNKQTKGTLRYMKKIMDRTQKPIIGCVINKAAVKKLSHKRYYYQYGGRYGYYSRTAEEKTDKSWRRGSKN